MKYSVGEKLGKRMVFGINQNLVFFIDFFKLFGFGKLFKLIFEMGIFILFRVVEV